jgi:hypothetical protein
MGIFAPPSTSNAKTVVEAESRFAGLLKSFFDSYESAARPHVRRLIACWLKEWLRLADFSIYPADNVAIEELEREICRQRWRRYNSQRREQTNARGRENYYKRKRKKDPNYQPNRRWRCEFKPRKLP